MVLGKLLVFVSVWSLLVCTLIFRKCIPHPTAVCLGQCLFLALQISKINTRQVINALENLHWRVYRRCQSTGHVCVNSNNATTHVSLVVKTLMKELTRVLLSVRWINTQLCWVTVTAHGCFKRHNDVMDVVLTPLHSPLLHALEVFPHTTYTSCYNA